MDRNCEIKEKRMAKKFNYENFEKKNFEKKNRKNLLRQKYLLW